MTLVELLHSTSTPGTAARLARDELVHRGLVAAPDRTVLTKEHAEATYSIRRNILQETRPDLANDLDDMLQRLATYVGDAVAVHLIPHEASLIILFTDERETTLFGGIVAPPNVP
jgi:hypothetical protein